MFVFNQSSRSLLFQMSCQKYFHTSYKLCSFGCEPVTKFWFDEKSALLFNWTISLLLFSFISLYFFCILRGGDGSRWMEGWWNTRAGAPTSVEPTSYVRPRTRDHHRNPFHSPNWTWRTCCCVLLGICYLLAFQCVDGYLLLSKTVVLVGKWQTACARTVGTCVKARRGVLQTQKRQKLSVH